MDYPTSPSPYDQFIKKQRQVSYNTEYKNKTQIHQQQSSDDTTIEAEVLVHKSNSLVTEFIKFINYNNTLVIPTLKLLDLYFYL
ncbi:unnamed protein product [Penicillium salamii]|uniref:Uncharacterized protein n=1 Tax=Penicillium salamii TaxID=1612424 RepID=A0A9W4I3M0_9EURO|nr:unnamed protein product [Penicillium salamii]CAG7972415.1 unnamed protein product [Penicillium salamii]CAG7979131.1 unnamed protein product [Penicillium salamii]CAG8213667.1 unnamed protein product [Penicillium salamii]CAG8237028.1 unnamed protein product [Penicillium salamii]